MARKNFTNGYSVSRLSLYATISAIEQDLRDLISEYLIEQVNPTELLGNLLEKATERLEKDREFLEEEPSTKDLILYIDFAESYQLLASHNRLLPKPLAQALKKSISSLEKLVPIRNRVMHSRPLGFDDFSITLDISISLLEETQRTIPWENLKTTLLRLQQEPSFVLGLQIPTYEIDKTRHNHNLPIPDFDETGFIGRQQYEQDLVNLCLGAYPVITIHGEGGLGKTALALKVAYNILDQPNCPFDAVAWTTSKTQQLTPQEIRRIEGAICNSLGMLQNVSDFLSVEGSANAMEEVLSYLEQFRILLIIDNLETILDERVREFLRRLSRSKSKVLITSRISVGAYDYPIRLDPMDTNDSVQLLRALAKIRGLDNQFKVGNQQIADYCKRMHNNPAYIKWFISAIQAGKRPEEILSQPDLFLDFCLSNVYQYLSESSQKVIASMLCMPGKHSYAELAFLNDMSEVDLRQSINQLLTTNMVIMSSVPRGSTFESQYELSELARDYLGRTHPVKPSLLTVITKRKNQLLSDLETMRAMQSGDPYSFNSITVRSSSDRIVAKYLLDALRKINSKQLKQAEKLLNQARSLAPDYFEVHRMEALLKFHQDDYTGASRAYEVAIELDPTSAPLRKWFGSFLLRYMHDPESALIQLTEAAKIDPDSPEVQIELARLDIQFKKFSEVERIINKLSRLEISERDQRKLGDLKLQLPLKQAEYELEQRNYRGALNYVEVMVKTYQDLASYLIDKKMLDKLRKAASITSILLKASNNSESGKKALKLYELLSKELGANSNSNFNSSFNEIDEDTIIEVGTLIVGRVYRVEHYGVFVKFGKTTGLLHISQISNAFVSEEFIWDTFKINTLVKALIVEIDEGRISLSTKDLESAPGEMLRDPDSVFENAENVAIKWPKS